MISLYFACIKLEAQQKLLHAIFGLNLSLEARQFSIKCMDLNFKKITCFAIRILLLTLTVTATLKS